MDNERKALMWIKDNPSEFVDNAVELISIGFDLDKNSAMDLIRCVYEFSGMDLNLPERDLN